MDVHTCKQRRTSPQLCSITCWFSLVRNRPCKRHWFVRSRTQIFASVNNLQYNEDVIISYDYSWYSMVLSCTLNCVTVDKSILRSKLLQVWYGKIIIGIIILKWNNNLECSTVSHSGIEKQINQKRKRFVSYKTTMTYCSLNVCSVLQCIVYCTLVLEAFAVR